MAEIAVHPINTKDFTLVPSLVGRGIELRLTGTVDMTTMDAFAEVLRQAHEEAERSKLREVCLDLQGMYFLNSTSLKNLTKLAMQAKSTGYTVRFVLNGRLTWQARAVDPIRRLAQGSVVIENVVP